MILPPFSPVASTPLRIDIGAGSHKMAGWTGMDSVAIEGIDVVHDFLSFPWPFEDESVSEARAEMVLEHIPHSCWCHRNEKDPLYAFMDEVFRVLVPGGKFHIIVPHSDSRRAWRDPTHCRAINEQSLLYLNKAQREAWGVNQEVQCNFDAAYEFVVGQNGELMDMRATLTKL